MNLCNGAFNSGQNHFSLLQSNRTEAAQLLAVAKRAGALDANDWAARALHCANQQGAAAQPVVVGRAMALAGQLAPGGAPDVRSLRQLAQALSTAPSAAAVAANASSSVPSNTAAAAKRSTSGDWRSAEVARAAFNHPSHWLNVGNGKLAPNAARLQGQSQQAWQALTQKFGDALAKNLFDAKVRGGDATAVVDAMQAAGSSKTLTIRDLAHLQFVAFTDGKPSTGPLPVNAPSLHDAFHSYGVSDFEEAFGDAHTEQMVVRVFGRDSTTGLNPARPLSEQAAAVQRIKVALTEQRASVRSEDLGNAVQTAFFRQNWAASPQTNAGQAQSLLKSNGVLAHLNAAEQKKVSQLLFDRNDPRSMVSISASFQVTGDRAALATRTTQWAQTMANLVASSSVRQAPTQRQFNEQAAQAIALALTLERGSPGALSRAPVVSGLSDAELTPALRQLDLRTAFPAVLREVRQALGLKP